MSINLNSVTQTNMYWPKLDGVNKTGSEAAGVQAAAEVEETAKTKGDYDVYESELTAEQSRNALVKKLKEEQAQIQERFLRTVQESITRQGKENSKAEETEEETSGQSVSADDYWGVEQTAQRIVDFSKALAGNDPAMAETVKAAFIQGYQEAQEAWGGELPSVCGETYNAVMELFDEWTQSAAA